MEKNVAVSSKARSGVDEQSHSDETRSQFGVSLRHYFPAVVLAAATLFFAYDIVADLRDESESLFHIAIEAIVFLSITVILFMELRRVGALRREISREQIKTARLSGELLAVMRDQFSRWGLSPSESEVAFLLTKGLSMREISEARQVKEKTIRQQATSVYAKSGYAGRHELAAHFIEDLMNVGGVAEGLLNAQKSISRESCR